MKTPFSQITLILLILASMFIIACEKEDDTSSDRTLVGYLESYCADPWFESAATDAEIIENMLDFLASEGIDVIHAKIEQTHPAQACLACHCESGRTIFGEVRNEDLEEIEEIGFLPQ